MRLRTFLLLDLIGSPALDRALRRPRLRDRPARGRHRQGRLPLRAVRHDRADRGHLHPPVSGGAPQAAALTIVPRTSPKDDRARRAAQDDGVAVGQERAGRARSASPRCRASGRRSCREANRSPGRTAAPLTVAWASICGNVQYRPRAFVRLIDLAVELDLQREVERPVALGPQVGQRLRVLRARRHEVGLERGQRHDPGRDRGRERLAQERAERLVLPALQVARAPVVDEHEAEDVLADLGGGDRRAERLARARSRSPARARCRAARSARSRAAGRAGARSACRRRRPSRRGRGSRSGGGASWAAAARRRAGTAARGSSRAPARRRSRRSRRSRSAAPARPAAAGRRIPASRHRATRSRDPPPSRRARAPGTGSASDRRRRRRSPASGSSWSP